MSETNLPSSPLRFDVEAVEAKSVPRLAHTVAFTLRQAAATFGAALLDFQPNWWELNEYYLHDIGKTRVEAEREKFLRSFGTLGR
jgi:hypothetical protein